MSWEIMEFSARCALRALLRSGIKPGRGIQSVCERWRMRREAILLTAMARRSRLSRRLKLALQSSSGESFMSENAEDPESIYHVPVMADEVTHWLDPAPGKLYLDLTFGGGGHTRRLIAAGADVMAMDRDADALAVAGEMEDDERWQGHLAAFRGDYDSFSDILETAGAGLVDGILLDAGTSSWQLDSPNRGFSLRFNGPLDMRMNRDAPLTAAEVVNTWPEEELVRIFFEYGEERAARRIAAAICRERARRVIATTLELADLIASVVPRHGPGHPAVKPFQAIRIAVNDELGCLGRALEKAHLCLKPGGRLVVLSFHSLEDRIAKTYMRRHSEETVDNPAWPAPRPNPACHYRLPVRKAITASAAELAVNPRARSAKLRVATRI